MNLNLKKFFSLSITIYFSFKKVRVESPRPCSSVNIRNCIQLNGDITTNTSHLQQQQHLMIESSSPISRQTTNNNRDRINNNTPLNQTTTYYSTRTGLIF